jgi:predicted NUDIX family NTP pyrophosphohydrolase
MTEPTAGFYTEIPVFRDFSQVIDDSVYRPMPDDWFIGLTDVIGSTRAIENGQYKAVNMAGAAAISVVMNALGHREFPFVFGGDGVSFAVPPKARDIAADALARTARWVEEEIDLSLRAAMVPVSDIRASGNDVLVARYGASPAVAYAMFSGHGVEWAETEMKRDRFAVDPAPPGARPDLTGLSCRWKPIESNR